MDNIVCNRLWTKDFILICLASLMTSIAMQILNSTISLYADSLGATATFSGIMATLFAVTAGVLRPIGGRFSDRNGRRLTIIIGTAVFAVSIMGFGVFAILPALLVFRAIQGVGFSTSSTAAAAAVTDVTPRHRLGEGLGYFGLGYTMAMAIGPAIGIPFAKAGNYTLLYIITAAMVVLGLVFAFFCNYEKRRKNLTCHPADDILVQDTPNRGIWQFFEKTALPASLAYMLCSLANGSVLAFVSLYAQKQGFNGITLFFLLQALMMFVSRFVTGRLYDRKGAMFVITPAVLIGITSFLLIILSKNETGFLIAGAVYGIAFGMLMPVFNTLAVQRAPAHRRGAASATFYLFIDIGIGLGSAIWGLVIDTMGFDAMFTGAAICLVLALVFSMIFFSGKISPPEIQNQST